MAQLAILADIHGNLEALEQVVAELDARGIDEIYCLGDLVGYCAEPNACVALARHRDFRSLTGNHELIALDKMDFDRCGRKPSHALRRTRETLDDASRVYLSALPSHLERGGDLVFLHGGVDDVCEYMSNAARILTNGKRFASRFPGAAVCFFGHTHVAKAYEMRGEHVHECHGHGRVRLDEPGAVYFVNPGSVDGSRGTGDKLARFCVFDEESRNLSFYTTRYDHQQVERRARRQGYRIPHTTLAWHRCVEAAERVASAAVVGLGAARSRAFKISR